ncbi:hypothetical protein Vi05172_g4114 [Venturia inaequalis]|nr:hypothetical protein Vi05172_g4114 [Venturia inaequalis]
MLGTRYWRRRQQKCAPTPSPTNLQADKPSDTAPSSASNVHATTLHLPLHWATHRWAKPSTSLDVNSRRILTIWHSSSKFSAISQKLIEEKKIRAHRHEVSKGGLDAIMGGLDDMKNGDISGT